MKNWETILAKVKKQKTYSRYWEAGGTLLATTVLLLFAIRPAITTILGLIGEIKAKEKLTKQMEQKINALVEAQDTFGQLQSQIAILDQFLPSNPDWSQTGAQILGLTQESKLQLKGLTMKLASPSKKKSELEVHFSGVGDYSTIQQLLSALAQLRRANKLVSYSIGKTQSEEEGQLRLTVQAVFWWRNDGK